MDNQENGSRSQPFHIRKATLEDIPGVQALIDLPVRTLHPSFYTTTLIDLALEQVTAVDAEHFNNGNYYVVEIEASYASSLSSVSTVIVGCGGWSHRTTLYGSDLHTARDLALLDPTTHAVKIRAMFVHPDWTRKGIVSMFLRACEEAVQEAGLKIVELRASLQGVAFYERKGYKESGQNR